MISKALVVHALFSEWVIVKQEKDTNTTFLTFNLDDFIEKLAHPHFNTYEIVRLYYSDLDEEEQNLLGEASGEVLFPKKQEESFDKLWNMYKED